MKEDKALSVFVCSYLPQNGTALFFRGQPIWEALMDELLSIGLSSARQVFLLCVNSNLSSFFFFQIHLYSKIDLLVHPNMTPMLYSSGYTHRMLSWWFGNSHSLR